jgi:DNA-binding transcriptional ArsR family regulator
LTATAVVEDDALWTAVADPTRRRVLDALLEHGEATTTTLAQGLPVTRQAVAKHLVVLNRVGLVAGQRRGREVRYVVRPARLDDAAEALARVAAQWDRRLARIKRLAESVQAEAGVQAEVKSVQAEAGADFQHRQGESNARSQNRNS